MFSIFLTLPCFSNIFPNLRMLGKGLQLKTAALLCCSASLAKWLSVCLQTKWLCVWIPLLTLKLQISHLLRARSFLTFRRTIVCGFTLKLVLDMIITYNQMHRTYKYSQHSSIIWPVRVNGWVFVYELSSSGFESRCLHMFFRVFF